MHRRQEKPRRIYPLLWYFWEDKGSPASRGQSLGQDQLPNAVTDPGTTTRATTAREIRTLTHGTTVFLTKEGFGHYYAISYAFWAQIVAGVRIGWLFTAFRYIGTRN